METTNKMKIKCKKIFVNYISDEGLVSRICKKLLKLINKNQTTQSENGQMTGVDISPKIHKWPIRI